MAAGEDKPPNLAFLALVRAGVAIVLVELVVLAVVVVITVARH